MKTHRVARLGRWWSRRLWLRRQACRPVDGPRPPAPALTAAGAEDCAQRLRRIAEQCTQGQAAGAELELHEWQRQPGCPPAARVLLAGLLARRGRCRGAIAVLEKPAARRDAAADPAIDMMLTALLLAGQQPRAAAAAATQLHGRHGCDPTVLAFLEALAVPGCPWAQAPSEAGVEQLAAELRAQPQVLPSLTAAQKLAPQPRQVELLRRALSRLARDLADGPAMLSVCQAQAELALLARDFDEARRWAHRGLKMDPYSATLALVLGRITDDEAVGPPARTVLAAAAQAHPDYPDVLAALIRRENSDGRATDAHWRLALWLARQPQHPVARSLQQELAA